MLKALLVLLAAAILTGGLAGGLVAAAVFAISVAVLNWQVAYMQVKFECTVIEGITAVVSTPLPAAPRQGSSRQVAGSIEVGGSTTLSVSAAVRGLGATDVGSDPVATQLESDYQNAAGTLGRLSNYVSVPSLSLIQSPSQSGTPPTTVSPVDAALVDWSSSNPAVASVVGGVVTGLSAGQATITGTYRGKSTTVDFTVTPVAPQSGSIIGTVASPQRGGLAGVSVSGGGRATTTGIGGSFMLSGLGVGLVAVSLGNLPSDCTNPAPQLVTVVGGGTVQADFSVACGTTNQGTPPDFACSAESSLKSLSADTPVLMTFRNQTSQALRMFWLSYTGERVYYPPDAQPGTDWTIQQTYLTHPWLVLGADGRCYGIWMPAAGRVVIIQ